MSMTCMNQCGISILYSQIWECKVLEHLGHSLKIPGWPVTPMPPVGPVLGPLRLVTSEKSRGEVCPLKLLAIWGRPHPNQDTRTREPRGLPPILLRILLSDSEKIAAPWVLISPTSILGELAWAGESLQ